MIAVVDYGAGNLCSVANALSAIGARYTVVSSAAGIEDASKVILPGVGHFGQIARELDAISLRDTISLRAAILQHIAADKMFLGVCLGMQVLFASSDEAVASVGLGLLPGVVTKFAAPQRVPHMGWNAVSRTSDSRLLHNVGDDENFYFANSYFCPVTAATTATTNHGLEFSSVVEVGNVFGVQFHPEKSGPAGLRVLENFAGLQC